MLDVLTDGLPGNRAWVYARQADLALAERRAGRALALAMRAQLTAPGHPAATKVVERVRRRVNAILPAVDAGELVEAVDRVEGWLTLAEAATLARCVAAAPRCDGAQVVEIGSYCGRSTVALARAIVATGSAVRLTAIDPHEGYAHADGRDTRTLLAEALRANSVDGVVDVVCLRSVDTTIRYPISMAFIDGLHDLTSVRADYMHIAPHLCPGALVAFHDYRPNFPGVLGTVNDVLARDDHELVAYVDALVAIRTPTAA